MYDALIPSDKTCSTCKHYKGWKPIPLLHDSDTIGAVNVCDAFPDGIPDDIVMGKNLHREIVDGDRGIRYEEGDNPGAGY